ncbi:MAG: hypothetical protein HYV97_14990 [Bdellovibrio sp.]|nr:hypothetical protein [Bdellovibrio sp.]
MKHLSILVLSLIFLAFGKVSAKEADVQSMLTKGFGGIDYTYSSPEIFFSDPDTLKLSAIWEILNCYFWDEEDHLINQCFNLEFYVVNPTPGGDMAFTSILEGSQCLTEENCEAIVQMPLVALLTPLEYEKYQLGLIVMKDIRLHLAFGGEEDVFGRIIGRKLATAYYDLKFVLNGTGFGSIAIMRMDRELAL